MSARATIVRQPGGRPVRRCPAEDAAGVVAKLNARRPPGAAFSFAVEGAAALKRSRRSRR